MGRCSEESGQWAAGFSARLWSERLPGTPRFRTASVKLVFETGSSAYSMDIPRDKEADAHKFAQMVERAMKRRR